MSRNIGRLDWLAEQLGADDAPAATDVIAELRVMAGLPPLPVEASADDSEHAGEADDAELLARLERTAAGYDPEAVTVTTPAPIIESPEIARHSRSSPLRSRPSDDGGSELVPGVDLDDGEWADADRFVTGAGWPATSSFGAGRR